jgi:hypothetical protein
MVARPRIWLHVAAWTIRVVVSGLFLLAAVLKIADPEDFARSVRAYHIVPWWAVHPTALIIPWIEVVMALALLAGRWWSAGALITGVLTVAYCAVHINAILRNLDVTCSCFGHFRVLTPAEMLVLNAGILAAIAALAIACKRLSPTPQPVEVQPAAAASAE